MDGTEKRPMTESQLDRDLETALGIEPSPEFLARVRTRVAAEPEPSRWRLSFEPMWGVALVGIILAMIVPHVMRSGIEQQEPTGHFSGVATVAPTTEQNAATAVVPQIVAHSQTGRPIRTPAPVESIRTVPLQLSPVLISEDERSAFEFFVAAVNQGRVPEKAVERAPSAPGEVPALAIEPLAIAPLPSLARVTEEGEGRWE
jgi:hypothetical protein